MRKRKLSEIKGEGAMSAFAALIDPICNMAEDEETAEMYRREHKPAQRDDRSYMLQQAYKVIAKHEDDFCVIMAFCYNTTPEKYRAQLTPVQALSDLSELITDEVWKTFLSPVQSAQSSTSAPGNTQERPTSAPSANTQERA